VTSAAAGARHSADVTVQMGPCAPGELKSLAELLDEVKDGDDREDRDEVTVRRVQGHERNYMSVLRQSDRINKLMLLWPIGFGNKCVLL